MARKKNAFPVAAGKRPLVVKAQRDLIRAMADRLESGKPFARAAERKLAVAHGHKVDVVAHAVPAIALGRRSQAVGLVVDVIAAAVVTLRQPGAGVVADIAVIARRDVARTGEAAARVVDVYGAVVEAV